MNIHAQRLFYALVVREHQSDFPMCVKICMQQFLVDFFLLFMFPGLDFQCSQVSE